MKRVRECVYLGELDLEKLVWTRGRDFPLARLSNNDIQKRLAFVRKQSGTVFSSGS
jgi:hypothetical protein